MQNVVPVIIGSTRRGRITPRVAVFMRSRLETAGLRTRMIDLAELNLPFLEERLKNLSKPPQSVAQFGEIIGACNSFVVVSPEYNGSIPGVLKNAVDYLNAQYDKKQSASLLSPVVLTEGRDVWIRCNEFFRDLAQPYLMLRLR